MVNYETLLSNIVKPLCHQPSDLLVKQMESLEENEILIYIYANKEDLGRLIGRKGQMANAIRTMAQVGAKLDKHKISIKFETV